MLELHKGREEVTKSWGECKRSEVFASANEVKLLRVSRGYLKAYLLSRAAR